MFEGATTDQVHAILAAAHRVVQLVPVGGDPRSGRGDALVVAAGRLLFTLAVVVDPKDLPPIEPQDLVKARRTPTRPSPWAG